MNTEGTNINNTIKQIWEQPELKILNINITSSGDNSLWSEDGWLGWLPGGGS